MEGLQDLTVDQLALRSMELGRDIDTIRAKRIDINAEIERRRKAAEVAALQKRLQELGAAPSN